MPTAYTSLLGLALPVQGELSGTWGDVVNTAITSLVDSAIAGTTTISTDTDRTLTVSTGIADEAREAILLCTGARTAIRTLTAPAQSKVYVVINATTGGYAVKLVGAGPTTGVTVSNGSAVLVAWNGSDFQALSSAVVDLASQVTGTLAVANGGTGTTTSTGTGSVVRATSPSLTTPTLTGYTETVYAISDGLSVDINPANGTIQTWTLGANRTPTAASFAAGQSVTLMIADGSAYAVTWTTIGVVWVGGSAPVLPTSGYGVVVLWKVGSTVYGSYTGAVA